MWILTFTSCFWLWKIPLSGIASLIHWKIFYLSTFLEKHFKRCILSMPLQHVKKIPMTLSSVIVKNIRFDYIHKRYYMLQSPHCFEILQPTLLCMLLLFLSCRKLVLYFTILLSLHFQLFAITWKFCKHKYDCYHYWNVNQNIEC